jgi:5-methylcytosine-specific restriction endonuclease McrA
MMTYAEKLKDPRWQKKRLEILDRDLWKCSACGDIWNTLNVHHKVYQPNIDPWAYKPELLVTLCDDCHKLEHDLMAQAMRALEMSIVAKGFLHSDFVDISKKIIEMPAEDLSKTFGIKLRR